MENLNINKNSPIQGVNGINLVDKGFDPNQRTNGGNINGEITGSRRYQVSLVLL